MAPNVEASVLPQTSTENEVYHLSYESESSGSNQELSSEDEGCHDSGISDDNKPFGSQKSSISGKMRAKKMHSKSKRTSPYYYKQELKSSSSGENDSDDNAQKALTNCKASLNQVKRNPDVNYLDLLKKLQVYVASIVSLEQYTTFSCYSDALRLANVTIVMTKSLQLGKFLTMFAHSVTCAKETCTTSCRMFKRVRSHVASADHSCAMMHVYGQLLRMHVDTCQETPSTCGMVSCKSMRDMRKAQGNRVLPADFLTKEKVIAEVLKQQFNSVSEKASEEENCSFEQQIFIKEEEIVMQEPDAALNLSTKGLPRPLISDETGDMVQQFQPSSAIIGM